VTEAIFTVGKIVLYQLENNLKLVPYGVIRRVLKVLSLMPRGRPCIEARRALLLVWSKLLKKK
jgi:hypothetical protein